MISTLHNARVALWHLRKGGFAQLRKFQSRQRATRSSLPGRGKVKVATGGGISAWPLRPAPQRRESLTVGTILDEFSELAFSYEWNQIRLDSKSWREQLNTEKLDLIFVESAWNGSQGSWQYQLTGPTAPSASLIELTRYAKQLGIPTVFWNKEDPAHYEDFIDAARLFSYIYTTDETLVSRYKEDVPTAVIGVLPFAAQIEIHNPVREGDWQQSRDIAFAGMYFKQRHESRRKQLDMLLAAASGVATRTKASFDIYSRFLGWDEKYQFPQEYDDYIAGSLSYQEMLTAYRLHKVFLNVNTITSSPSMCARRVFEITASGGTVISTPSVALAEFFPDSEIVTVNTLKEATFAIRAVLNNDYYRDMRAHKAQRRIWASHTYEHRVNQVLSDVGLPNVTKQKSVSILMATNRPSLIQKALKSAIEQNYSNYEVIIGTHGFSLSSHETRELLEFSEHVQVELFSISRAESLGGCLNLLVERANGELITKMDDDDFYSENYLTDLVNAWHYSGAQLVGKGSHFVYDESNNVLMHKNPELAHTFSQFVAGPTLLTERRIAREIRFEDRSSGEDTAFLQELTKRGGRIYSADPYNFVLHRRSNNDNSGHKHTWQVSSWELLANSRFVTNGFNVPHLTV